MAEDRTYYVVPAEVLHEHGRPVKARNRWKAWRAARHADPMLSHERVVIIASTQVLEIGGEKWAK